MKMRQQMQFAHRNYVANMLDGKALEALVEEVKPDLIVPEVEAIATQTLIALEQRGWRVIPTAKATKPHHGQGRHSPLGR